MRKSSLETPSPRASGVTTYHCGNYDEEKDKENVSSDVCRPMKISELTPGHQPTDKLLLDFFIGPKNVTSSPT